MTITSSNSQIYPYIDTGDIGTVIPDLNRRNVIIRENSVTRTYNASANTECVLDRFDTSHVIVKCTHHTFHDIPLGTKNQRFEPFEIKGYADGPHCKRAGFHDMQIHDLAKKGMCVAILHCSQAGPHAFFLRKIQIPEKSYLQGIPLAQVCLSALLVGVALTARSLLF
ncbi:MAG: hypothetical protein JWO53_572 [Chlamydiia bacterium]|nr:hypothetical protein [Chlamydiia bacterium]